MARARHTILSCHVRLAHYHNNFITNILYPLFKKNIFISFFRVKKIIFYIFLTISSKPTVGHVRAYIKQAQVHHNKKGVQ